VDATFPGETTKGIADQIKKAAPQLVTTPVNSSVLDHLVVNTKRPRSTNAKSATR